MTDTRRLHQCKHDGCSSQAEWQPMIQFRCSGGFLLKMPSTAIVCDKHVKAALELVTNDHAKDQMRWTAFAQGWGMPDFSSLQAMMAPVEHDKVEGNA